DSLPPQKFNHLVNIVVSTYVNQHPEDFKYCTTPDCVQIYCCDAGEQKCPSCFAEICSFCHEGAHRGMTCVERALHSNQLEQGRLNEHWAAENGVRKCPSCSVWMQKIDGCNHMVCTCGAYICWVCMLPFPRNEIYLRNETLGMLRTIEEQQEERRGVLETERQRRVEKNERVAAERIVEENKQWLEAVRQQEIAVNAVAMARAEAEKQENILQMEQSVTMRKNRQQGARRRIGAFEEDSDSN
ncbi:hypothetical protein BDZ94DRAFT_1244632, partial [Collybia nuda]